MIIKQKGEKKEENVWINFAFKLEETVFCINIYSNDRGEHGGAGQAVINAWHITGRNNYAYQYQVSNRSSNFHNWIVASTRLHRRHRVRLSVLDIFRNCVILDG